MPARSFRHKSCLRGPVGRVEPAAGGAAGSVCGDARAPRLASWWMAAGNLHFIPASDPLPAPKSWDAAEGGGDCRDPPSFGAAVGREPQQNTSSSLFPAKALSNDGRGREREGRGGCIKSVQRNGSGLEKGQQLGLAGLGARPDG